MKHRALSAIVSAALVMSPVAATAAGAFQPEQHRAAFAGATLRLTLDGRGRTAPQARLGIGFTQYGRDGSGALVARGAPRLPLEAGIATGRLQFYVGGEPASRIERRLAADGTTTALFVVGGLAVGALAIVLLASEDDDDGPCPPGVEVCAF